MAKSETVPKAMREKFGRITTITDRFAQQHLNDEYATLIRQATAALCRKRPSPLMSGREKTWACGITHAIGMANFLFDSSQDPHISAKELYASFGISSSTGQAKSKQVRDTLKISQMSPDWCLPSQMDKNPMAWLISINGMIIDARSAPLEVQERLVAAGLIPYMPGQATEPSAETLQVTTKSTRERSPDLIYVLNAHLIEGPITEEFIDDNPQVSRTIEIEGDQPLKMLHQILFKAFDREEDHTYELQVGGRGPNDPKARRYGLKQSLARGSMGSDLAGDVDKTTLNDLELSVGDIVGYWFDFGDDWWHAIEVKDMKKKVGKGKLPKITNRLGASPPQYAEFEWLHRSQLHQH